MKTSRYNILFDLPENKTLLAFNSYSLNFLEFPMNAALVVKTILNEPDQRPKKGGRADRIRNMLIRAGFLVEDFEDEIGLLKAKNLSTRFARKDFLGLTIAPTLECNFRCVYCYEHHRKERMSPPIIKGLLQWVKKETKGGKGLFVTWFGGEPLLALKEIALLTEGFREITRKNSARFSANMITNGYLLDRSTAKRLKELGIGKVQITLDGPENIHNKRRPLANGKGTFSRILSNIKAASDLLAIDVRINVDKENMSYARDLLDILEREGLKNRVNPYFGHVYAYTDACADIQGSCLRKEDFSLLEASLKLEMINRGFSPGLYPSLKGGFCTADSYSSKVVAPSGAFVKCWNEISLGDEAVVGHVHDRKQNPRMLSNLSRWLAWDPFEKKACRECQILPICMGGCPDVAFRKGLKRKGECIGWKYNLKEILSLYYLQKKKREELEIARALVKRIERIKKEMRAQAKNRLSLPPADS